MAGGIRINLDNASKEQLLNEVDRLKTQLENKNIVLKIDDNNIKNQIESMRTILESFSNNNKPIEINIDSVKAKEELSKIQGGFEQIIAEYSKLGNINVSQKFDDQGQLQSFVVKLEQVNGLIEKIKYNTSETSPGMFAFQGSSQVNNINKTTQALEEFRSKWQSTLNEISGKGLIDNNDIQKTQQLLNNLNLNNFKESSNSVKENINGLTAQIKEMEVQSQRIRGFGQNVGSLSSSGLGMDSSIKDIQNFLKSTESYKAQITSITEDIDKLGNNVKKVNYTIDEGNNVVSKYRLTLDESTGSVYKMSTGIQDLSNKHATFMEQLGNSISAFLRFQVIAAGIVGVISEIKNGVSTINELNKSQTNIAMVTGESMNTVKQYTQQYANLSTQLHTTITDVMQAGEEFLRAGNNQKESLDLVKASTVMSKEAGQSQQDSAQTLIALMNAYKMSASDMMSVVDKFTKVDNESATSVSEMSTAINKVANSGQQAGVSLDTLISYIATISSTTRQSAETVGSGLNSIFSRYQSIREGKDFDPDNNPLNNVEKAVNRIGVSMRSSADTFKPFTTVLDEISNKWNTLNDVERNEIATAMAGTYQRNTFLALMSNMNEALKLQSDEANAAGSAMNRYQVYIKSTQARLDDAKNALQKFWYGTINSETINSIISGFTKVINSLMLITTTSKESGIALLGLSTAITVLSVSISRLGLVGVNEALISFGSSISTAIKGLVSFTATEGIMATVTTGLSSVLNLLISPLGLLTVALGAATYAVVSHIQHEEEMKEKTDSLKTSYEGLTQAMKDNSSQELKTSLEPLQKQTDELKKLKEQKQELENQISSAGDNDLVKSYAGSKLKDVNEQITDLTKQMKDAMKEAGVSATTLVNAQNQLSNINMLQKYQDEANAQNEKNNALIKEIQEYQNLNSVENKNATQKERMTQLSQNLKSSINGLITSRDSEGNTIITNTELLDKNIKMLQDENSTSQTGAKVKAEAAKNNMTWQVNETTITYGEIKKRIAMYEAEMTAAKQAAKQAEEYMGKSGITEGMGSETAIAIKEQPYTNALVTLDQIYNSTINTTDATAGLTDENNNGYIPSEEDATESTKANTEAQKAQKAIIDSVKEKIKEYASELENLNNIQNNLETSISHMDDTSQKYRDSLQEEINLLQQKNGFLQKGIDLSNSSIVTLSGYVTNSSVGTQIGQAAVNEAEKYLNTPYVWGGESPSEGFDCSGLVQYVYSQLGIELGRTTYDQVKEGVEIPKQDLQPGDLVFFGDASAPHHVGIYVGADQYIQAPKTGDVVKVSSLSDRNDYATARRVSGDSSTSSTSTVSVPEEMTYQQIVNQAASKYGLDPALIAAVIEQESTWKANEVSDSGAVGLMQLMPDTAAELGVSNSYDAIQNIMGGSKYLSGLISKYGETKGLALYNTGEYGGGNYSYAESVLAKKSKYANGSSSIPDTTVSTEGDTDVLSQMDELNSKAEDYQKQITSNASTIIDLYGKMYTSMVSYYKLLEDNSNKQLELDKQRYELYEKDNNSLNDSSRQYMQKQWQDINEQYGILVAKENYIKSQLENNVYDEKTIAQMKTDLLDVQQQEVETVNDLHTAFKDWLADRLTYNTQGYQDNIDMLNAQLDLVNEIDEASNYSSKASYNQQILEQQLKINDALKNQIDFVQKLYDKEQSGNTRLLWSEQLEDLNKQLVESQTNIEKTKKAIEDSVISGILDSVDKKLRLINDDLKDIQSATKDISDFNTSQKLIDNMNILQDQMTILIEDTNAYAELYSQVSADGTITSDEQSKLDSQSDKIRTDKENIQSSVQAINSLNLSNVIQPFENILSSLANNTNALKLQLDMLSSSSTDYATKAGLINEELNNNNLNMENLVSEYNALMNQTATPGTKEADDLTKALETVRDKIGEAAKEGITLKNSLNDVKLSALFNQIQIPQDNINQMLSNMDFVTSMSKAGQTNGLLIGGNYQDTTKNYEDQTLENEQETLDIINDINGKIEDLQSTTYDIDTSDLQDAVTEKIDTTNDLLQNIQDGITNINDNNSKTVETKNVYGTDYDLQYFEEMASKLGMSGLFNYVDTNKSEYLDNRDKYKIGSNDIVLGGTGAAGGISDSDTAATRLGGVDKSGTQSQIESYLKSLLDVLSDNSGNSSNVDTEKTNQELINTLNSGAIANNTEADVNAVKDQTTVVISNDNANVANEIATITEQGQNITEGLSTVDTSIDIGNSNIETLRTSLTTVLGSILEKINTLDTETSLQELINLHGSVNNIGDLVATVNNLSFNSVATVSVKKEKVDKKAMGNSKLDPSILGDGNGEELVVNKITGETRLIGKDGYTLVPDLDKENDIVLSHEDTKKVLNEGGIQKVSKYAEGTYKLYAQKADTNAEGLLGDYQYARQLLQTLGRTDIQLIDKEGNSWGNKTLGDNDYIMGGSAVISSPEGFDESHRIWGATRKETESALQSFLSSHPMVATSSDINSSGSSNNATTPTSTSTDDYNTSTGSTGTGSSTSSAGVISEDTDVRKKIKTNISNIQSNYNDQLQNGSSTSDLLKDQISLEQQSILLNNDALKQLKQQEELYADDADALKKIADEESNLNKEIQDSQKKITDLAKNQVDQITAINDAKNEQLEIDMKIQGSSSIGNSLLNYEKQLNILKYINQELLNYQDSLNKLNEALTEQQSILNTFNSSKLSTSENETLKNLLLEQAKNGYLNTSESTILSSLENKLSDEDKITLQGIAATLTALYNKKEEVQIDITTTAQNLISNIETTITNNLDEVLKKFEEAVSEQTKALDDSLTRTGQSNTKNDQLAELNKLQKEYNEALANNSVEGKSQAADLKRQIDEQQRKITETNVQNLVTNTKQYLQDQVDANEKIVENAKDDLSETLSLVEDGVISADEAITRYKEKWSDDIKSLGSDLQVNVIDLLTQIQEITKDLNLNITTTTTSSNSSGSSTITSKIASMDSGGYTGDFGTSDGKLAVLHQNELVLNPLETNDMLDTAKALENVRGYDLFTNSLVPSVLQSSDISKLVTTNSMVGDTNHNYELIVKVDTVNASNKSDVDQLWNTMYSNIKRIGGDFTKVR